ncbi:2' O-ribose methyltransferase [Pleosporales sp. CAS-2024a]
MAHLHEKHKLFQPGQTVVDLGYAPGSWSQVAVNRTSPNGRVIGIDVIPAQPPSGVSTIQGNFLSEAIQDEVRAYVRDPELGRPRRHISWATEEGISAQDVEDMERGYIDMERQLSVEQRDGRLGRAVDVVLSDMSEPWDQTAGFYKKSLSDPYFRMMNTSGNAFRDHAGSMDLCMAALTFAYDTLKTGGHFVCKFYQGAEEKALETKLKRLFAKVHREKPDSSRAESKEGYFVGVGRKAGPTREEVFGSDDSM